MLLAFVGSLIVNAGTIPLMNTLGAGDPQAGYQLTILLFSLIMVGLFFTCFSIVREKIPVIEQSSSIKTDLNIVIRNRAWWSTVLMGIPIFALMMSPFSVGMYYFTYNVGDVSKAPIFFTAGTLGMIAGATACIFLVKKVCKRHLIMSAMVFGAVVISQLFWVNPQHFRVIYGTIFFAQFFMGISAASLWGLVADMADFIEWKSGRRVVGLATSSATFSHKFGMGLGGALVGFSLSQAGYIAGAEQTPEALTMIKIFMSLVPAAGAVFVIIIAFFYPVTRSVLHIVQKDLDAKRNAQEHTADELDTELHKNSRLA
jgi:GPH family glycoside/pentoside/hexuronide:cation symporter